MLEPFTPGPTGAADQRYFLRTIQAASIIKSKRIQIGLAYLETKVATGSRLSPEMWNRRIELFGALRELNRRGILKAPMNVIPPKPGGRRTAKRSYSDQELSEMMQHTR